MNTLGVSFLILIGSGVSLTSTSYEKIGAPEHVNQYVERAFEISNGDKDFIHTLECENDRWTPDRMSDCFYYGGQAKCSGTPPPGAMMEISKGFCQINARRKPHLYYDPNFLDPERQLNACYRLFSENPYQFSGYRRRAVCASRFDWTYRTHDVDIGNLEDPHYRNMVRNMILRGKIHDG